MMTVRPFAALAAALLLSACGDPPVDHAAVADAAYAGQNYFAARDAAQKALRDDPEDAAALETLARAQIAMGLGGDALLTLDRLAALGARPEDENLLRAEAHLQTGDTKAALALLGDVPDAEAWRLRALAAAQEGDIGAMEESFAKGRTAPGDPFRLTVAEASWYIGAGDAAAARPLVQRAQQAQPDRVETLFVTARLAQLDGKADLATRAYMGILDKSPLDRPALLGAIAELGNLERIDLVRPLVARGNEAYPNDPEFIFLAARMKVADGDWKAARDILQAKESVIGESPQARGLYAEALLRLGQVEMARAHLAQLYRQFPDNPMIVRTYAEALLVTGDKAEARSVIAPLANGPEAQPADRALLARTA